MKCYSTCCHCYFIASYIKTWLGSFISPVTCTIPRVLCSCIVAVPKPNGSVWIGVDLAYTTEKEVQCSANLIPWVLLIRALSS